MLARKEVNKMNKIPTYNWKGYSGKTYTYFTYRLPVDFNLNQPGNYIFSRQNTQGNWLPIYIGQGDLNDRVNYHHQTECIRQKGATHFHCHTNSAENDRLEEESDLLNNHSQSYQPTGCNELPGG